MALGAYKVIYEQGLKIPDDISIVSFDDIQVSKYLSPPLTTVQVSLVKMASKVSSILIKSVENNKIKQGNVLVDTKIIERKSCKNII